MDIVINEAFKAYIDPLTPDEHAALERSLLAEGCRDALVLWGNVLVDGHNRYGICRQHGLPFQTVQNPRFQSEEDVHLWMIDQHLGRRSLSDFQRGVLALRKREIAAARQAQARAAISAAAIAAAADAPEAAASAAADEAGPAPTKALPPPERLDTREALARAARLSSSQVQMVEKIQKQGTPELVAAVRAGTVSINAAAAVATLPAQAQAEAAAGGAEALKQAAKQVRDARRKPAAAAAQQAQPADGRPTDMSTDMSTDGSAALGASDDPATLRLRVQALEAENARLRQQVQALQARLGDPALP